MFYSMYYSSNFKSDYEGIQSLYKLCRVKASVGNVAFFKGYPLNIPTFKFLPIISDFISSNLLCKYFPLFK